ncbi:hypothetical protein SADUNF_Sadunf03G0118800 [Salix dunnii]|uniref:Uncharacterized protein n=1 Tax=Salix dunnii TaxID=1413687 RepID=A0A835TGA9_9ROSI|nr:hypothetical protein SADUNF_Sadunf03G0118800 [Salix dunnii]
MDMKAPLLPFSTIPSVPDTNPSYPPLLHKFSPMSTFEYQNPNTQAFLESGSKFSIGSVPVSSSTSHPSEFSMLDESCMWVGGYEPVQSIKLEKEQPEQQALEIEKTNELMSVGQNMDASFETSTFGFDLVDSTLLPCEMFQTSTGMLVNDIANKLLAEHAGFDHDKEKNRYFPLKGSIPGSSSTNNSQEPSSANTQASVSCIYACLVG